jgi:hypothetical protein
MKARTKLEPLTPKYRYDFSAKWLFEGCESSTTIAESCANYAEFFGARAAAGVDPADTVEYGQAVFYTNDATLAKKWGFEWLTRAERLELDEVV